MKTRLLILTSIFLIFAIFPGCEDKNNGTGTLNLSLTDAPTDQPDITGVYITITGLEYHKQNNSWQTFEAYEGPKTVNLLDLTDGMSEMLGSFEMEAGQYNQLRFMLDAPLRGESQPSNPGCYLEYNDGSETAPLFVPSGGNTGYKATGAFTVPSNGSVELTADFNVRKSVVETGTQDLYILQPTIRLIVNNEAGTIAGGITNLPTDGSEILVYAYEDGTYSDTEAAEPDVETSRFPGAVTSDALDEENSYQLNYLAPMTYDLVVVRTLDGQFQEVKGLVEDVVVESKKTTNAPIDLSSL
jgi:hypothetical protein